MTHVMRLAYVLVASQGPDVTFSCPSLIQVRGEADGNGVLLLHSLSTGFPKISRNKDFLCFKCDSVAGSALPLDAIFAFRVFYYY